MKDGDLKITQSLAILKYIARRHDLIPAQLATADMLEQQVIDSRSAWGKFNYGGTQADDEFVAQTLKPQFAQWNAFLANKVLLNNLKYILKYFKLGILDRENFLLGFSLLGVSRSRLTRLPRATKSECQSPGFLQAFRQPTGHSGLSRLGRLPSEPDPRPQGQVRRRWYVEARREVVLVVQLLIKNLDLS